MSCLTICLFGEFMVQSDGQEVPLLAAPKAQQLLAFLLLNRDRPQHRETILGALWSDTPEVQGRKALRQALWQLQAALKAAPERDVQSFVRADTDRIALRLDPGTKIDIAAFQQAYARAHGLSGNQMTPDIGQVVEDAVSAYRGDLLCGWYYDWLLFDRESLQSMLIIMLDKLVTFYEAIGNYERGLVHGRRILRFDRAHERAHRRLMRLHFLCGDRTAALRQFERCVAALAEELDVKPSRTTLALYNQIRDGDDLLIESDQPRATLLPATSAIHSLGDVIDYLKHLQPVLGDTP